MSRKEKIRFLSKKGVNVSAKDSMVRIDKKMSRYEEACKNTLIDRRVRKISKRISRRLCKGHCRVPNWMTTILTSDDSHSAMVQKAKAELGL